jgi:predicted DNA binding CopG/RHH family protein
MEATKSIQINYQLHTHVKKYCSDNGLKLQKFVEKLIQDGLSKSKEQSLHGSPNNKLC